MLQRVRKRLCPEGGHSLVGEIEMYTDTCNIVGSDLKNSLLELSEAITQKKTMNLF